MRDMAAAALLGAGKDTVADAEPTLAALFHHAKARRRAAPFPAVGYRPDRIALDRGNAQHGDFGKAAMLVERPPRRHVDDAFVGHVLEQRLQRDLVGTAQREMLGNLALADRTGAVLDETQYLLARGETRRLRFGLFHRGSSNGFTRRREDAKKFPWAERPSSPSSGAPRRDARKGKPLRGKRDIFASSRLRVKLINRSALSAHAPPRARR